MEQLSHLIIQVSSNQVEAAEKRLDELGYSAKRAEGATKGVTRASDGLSASMLRLLGPLLSVGSAYTAFNKLFTTARQFEVLEAQLKTATGSAENAVVAFQAIQDFAKETPYDLAQATESFIALVNLGLTPSERALRSYGNTASALGRRMDEMVNAVAKATTGEFEPLKSFGVKARKEADGISFTFRGLTEKVRDDTRSIEDYFIRLGEANFSTSMLERMNTLDGAVSNLGDSWDQLFAAVSEAGAGELIERSVRAATASIDELIAMVSSGQLEAYLDAWIYKFDSLGEGVHNAIANTTFVLDTAFEYWSGEGRGTVSEIEDAFLNMPENIAAVVKSIGATLALLHDVGDAVGRAVYDSLIGWVEYGGRTIDNLIAEIIDRVKDPLGEGTFDYTAEQAKAFSDFSARVASDWKWVGEEIDRVSASYGEVVTEIMNERDASLKSFQDKIDGANRLRQAYDEQGEARRRASQGTDRLAPFVQGGDGGRVAGEEERRKYEALVDSLVDEEEAVQRSYDRRLQLIRDNTVGQADLERELTESLNQRRVVELHQAGDAKITRLTEQYNAEHNALLDALDRREITEEEFQKRSQENWKEYSNSVVSIGRIGAQKIATMQMESYSTVLSFASDISNNLNQLVQDNSDAAKALFVISKAIAIAQAIVYTHLAAARAPAEAGPIAGIPLATAIMGLGYANVAIMAATAIAGYEHGGLIPAGRTGLVGETGMPELVRGPAMVSSARTTADHKLAEPSGGSKSSVVINIVNNSNAEITAEERTTESGQIIDIIVSRVRGEVARDIRTGGSAISSAMESTYRVRRGAA